MRLVIFEKGLCFDTYRMVIEFDTYEAYTTNPGG